MPQGHDSLGSFIRRGVTLGSRPVHEFPARAGIGLARPPRNLVTLPLGDVFLYPEGLVFLTLEAAPLGEATKAEWMESREGLESLPHPSWDRSPVKTGSHSCSSSGRW